MMKRIVLLLTLVWFVLSGAATLKATCSDASLNGLYGFYQWGYYGNDKGSGVGYWVFNGAGTVTTGYFLGNNGGTVEQYEPTTGSYSVNSSTCQVTINATGQPTIEGTVTAGGLQIEYMVYASDIWITGFAYGEQLSECEYSTMAGNYGAIVFGYSSDTYPTSDFGNFTLYTTGSYGGTLYQYGETYPQAGSYNPSGYGGCQIVFYVNDVATWEGVDVGNQIFVANLASGNTWLYILQKE
jgi:hypothetical protein